MKRQKRPNINNSTATCSICGSNRNVIWHHEKYYEIHGEEKLTLLCRKCHSKLHVRLREEGKCNVLPQDLIKYSVRSYVSNHCEYYTCGDMRAFINHRTGDVIYAKI